MTALQLSHIVSTGIFLGISGYVLWRAPRLQRSAWVAAISVCFAWWSATLYLAHDPSATQQQAINAYDIGAIAWASFGSASLAFALAFAGKGRLLARRAVQLALIVPPLVVMIQQWRGGLAASYPHETWGWAYRWSASWGTLLFYAYYATYTTAAFAVVIAAGRGSTDRVVRRQAAIIVYSAGIPFVGATATDVVLPWLDSHAIPNIAPTFLIAWTIGIAIATVRYRLFEITPETAADEILSAMSDGMLLLGRDGRVVASNPAANRMLANGADLRGVDLATVLAKAAGASMIDASEIVAANRTLAISKSTVSDTDGITIGSICMFHDITDRKEAEQALAAAHTQLEARVLARTHELDDAYRELQRVVRALGVLHATVDVIHKANSTREIGAGVVRALAELVGCRIVLDDETFVSEGFAEGPPPIRIAIAASSKLRGSFEVHAEELREAERQVVTRVASEIGQALEGLALRHALAQSDRLASIGVLAAGVAHEINNPLTYLTLGLYDIQEHIERGRDADLEVLRTRAGEALDGCERITKIVRELGSFARDGDEVQVLTVSEAVDAAVAMATHQIRHRARMIVRHDATATVRADLGRLTQVFLNLLVNAAHAIPDGSVDVHQIEIASHDEAAHVVVRVSDTGHGIAADDVGHVFEPFFTTAEIGEGSGLGLSICQKIVRSLGGVIAVESVVGKGTRFTVRLPRAGEPPARAPTPVRPTLSTPPGARILIVDDDPPVAAALARILEAHAVTIVESGAAARRLLETGAQFDLVMCDVMMPDLNGPELHAWINVHHPALAPRMVFMTGGAFTPETEAFFEAHRAEIVAKPFKPDAILAVVAEVLRRSRAS